MSTVDDDEPNWGGPVPLVVCSAPEAAGGVESAFNLIPMGALSRVAELWTTVATPLPWFRPLPGRSGQRPSETGQRLDLWFHDARTPYRGGDLYRRPVLYWAGAPFDAETIASIAEHSPMFMLVASRFIDHLRQLELRRADLVADDVPASFLPIEGSGHQLAPDAPEAIWSSYSALWQSVVGTEPLEQLRGRRIVPADAGSRPNEILLARLRGEHAVFGVDPIAVEQRDAHRVANAREILIERWTNASRPLDDDDIRKWRGLHAQAFAVVDRSDAGDEPIDALMEIVPVSGLIVVGPSASIDTGAIGLAESPTLSDRMASSLGRASEYARKLLAYIEELSPGGGLPAPADDDEARIYDDVIGQLSGSVQFQTAMATLYAHRTLAPVFVLPRARRSVFDVVQAVDDAVASSDDDAIRNAVGLLSAEVDELVQPLYGRIFGVDGHRRRRSSPLIHAFADYPLEFATDQHDYLGFSCDLSRSPITPGAAMIHQHASTEFPAVIRASMFQISIASALDGESFSSQVFDRNFAPWVPRVTISSRSEALAALGSARDHNVFIFVGHGYADAKDGGRSGLVFPDDGVLWASEIEELAAVPGLVVLIACNSADTHAFRGGIARAFLNGGARAVVGSTFAVPEIDAAFFAKWLINLLLLHNDLRSNERRWQTLPAIVRWARLGARPESALTDLRRRGTLSLTDVETAIEHWHDRVTRYGVQIDPAHPDWTRALAETLFEFEVISSADEPPMRWPVVPYPLFFSMLGYSWNLTVTDESGEEDHGIHA